MKGIRGNHGRITVGRTSVSDIQLTADTLKLIVELVFKNALPSYIGNLKFFNKKKQWRYTAVKPW